MQSLSLSWMIWWQDNHHDLMHCTASCVMKTPFNGRIFHTHGHNCQIAEMMANTDLWLNIARRDSLCCHSDIPRTCATNCQRKKYSQGGAKTVILYTTIILEYKFSCNSINLYWDNHVMRGSMVSALWPSLLLSKFERYFSYYKS